MNPFIHGRALTAGEVAGRSRELRRLVGRISRSELTAIIGPPRVGKTSLLRAVVEVSAREGSDGGADRYVFCLLDGHALRGVRSQGAFWELVLAPAMEAASPGTRMASAGVNETCVAAKAAEFAIPHLERVFERIEAAGVKLVVLLDEFDDLLSHEALNNAGFYGSLRSLGSRCGGLVIVIATRQEPTRLNQLTQQFTPYGSPYFNVFTELRLGAFSPEVVSQLLDRSGHAFDSYDRDFVVRVSGGQPYLVQAAAAALWDAADEGLTGGQRFLMAARRLYQETQTHFADTWRGWTNETRKAATAVALSCFPALVGEHQFQVASVVDHLEDYQPELEALEAGGLLRRQDETEWRIAQEAFLWWLADELRRDIREESDFSAWIRAQEMDGVLTRREQERLGQAARGMLAALGRGGSALIEVFAKGLGAAAVKAGGG